MNSLARRFRAITQRRRWVSIAGVLFVVGLLVWYFFLRSAPGPGPSAGPPPPRPALGKSVTYREYTAAVLSALSDVRKARPAALGDEREVLLEKAAATLEGVEGAAVPSRSGGVSEVDNTALIRQLRESDPDVESVEASLALLAAGLQGGSTSPIAGTLDGAGAEAKLREVLSDPIFDYEEQLSPLRRLARWLASLTGGEGDADLWRWFTSAVAVLAAGVLAYLASDRIKNRWARLGLSVLAGLVVGVLFYTGLGALGTTVQLLGAVGLVVAVVAVALMVSGLYRGSSPSARPPAVSELAAVLGMHAAEARKRADEAAGAGDFRGAIRFRCLAVLLALDEVGMLAFDRAATNREYLFRAPGDLQSDLQPLLSRFDAIWYGGSPTDAVEWQGYNERAARIEARVADEAQARQRARRAA